MPWPLQINRPALKSSGPPELFSSAAGKFS